MSDTPPGPPSVPGAARPSPSGRREPPRPRRPRRRTFYSIGEVCEMLDLKPHVLRYWETQFDQLHPSKNRAGARVYQAHEVEIIALIRRLVHDERYTIQGARRRLEELHSAGVVAEQSVRSLERSLLRSVDRELREVLDLLDPAPVDRGGRAG